jgi:predicted component of type VI protein secretion system
MINQFEIGGNEVKIDASEAIAAIPENRTLLVEQLTADEPVNPDIATGLTSIEQVFDHYKPQIDVDFQNAEGQPVKETFRFQSVGDFSAKNLTEQSSFLKGLSTEKDFYDNLTKQLRSNKVLQRALENLESKRAFIATLRNVLEELHEAEIAQ